MKRKTQTTLTPTLRFPEFRDAPGWDAKPLGSVAELRNGYAFKSSKYVEAGSYGIVTIANVQAGRLSLESVKQISDLPDDLQQHQQLELQDILISMTGNVGRICRVTENNLLLNQRVGKLIPRDIIEDFLYQSLQRETFRNRMQLSAAGGAQGNLSSSTITSYSFACPSNPAEQQKIAACLSSLDGLIAAAGRKLAALRGHKRGLMQQLFPQPGQTQPRLRFPEFRDRMPWIEKEVGDIFDVTRGQVLAMPLVQDTKSDEMPYPVYSSRTKDQGLSGYYSEYLFEDAITWTTDGANAGDVNYRPGKFYCTNVCGVLLSDAGHANACVAALLNAVTRSHVSYVGNPKLMNGVMAKIVIPFPEPDEQKRIADCLAAVDTQITAQAERVECLKQHKRGLMQQLFPSGMDE